MCSGSLTVSLRVSLCVCVSVFIKIENETPQVLYNLFSYIQHHEIKQITYTKIKKKLKYH